ncbi:hypothetical protein TKK_0006276 [Trichogramma kaykai]|uniref:BTB domain-containing protein n=1 Tax=Trichogramma kaykai TaxID=54128 RepID=A0ABD2XDE9_9HYME
MQSSGPACREPIIVDKAFGESINIDRKIESELPGGPNEIADVHFRLQNFASSAPQRYCTLCQLDHKKLQLKIALRFRNDAHTVLLSPVLGWTYEVEARVCVMVNNETYHLNYQRQSKIRIDATLEFPPMELLCPRLGQYNETTLTIKHVCWKISKVKVFFVLETQTWHKIPDLGPCFKDLYLINRKSPMESRCDVAVRVGSNLFLAHKAVLCAKSFKISEFLTAHPTIHEIFFTDVYPDVVQIALKFFYTNELDRLGYKALQLCDLLIRLYYFAKTHQFEQLRLACLDDITFTVIPATAPIYVAFAAHENLPGLHQSLQAYSYHFNGVQSFPQPAGVVRQ